MNTKKSNYDQTILVAADLFLSKGVKATSIDLIVRESGVSKSNIYYHFKSKEDIILAVVDRQIDWFQLNVLTPIFNNATNENTLKLLEQYFMGMSHFLETSDCKKGCPFASFIIQLSQTNEKVRGRISEFFMQVQQELSGLVQEGIEKGDIDKDIDPDQTAQFIFSLIEGSILLAMTHRDPTVIHNAANMLKVFLQKQT